MSLDFARDDRERIIPALLHCRAFCSAGRTRASAPTWSVVAEQKGLGASLPTFRSAKGGAPGIVFGGPPADLVDGDSDTNRVLSSTSSSDYLHIKGTPGRFSAGRESQR
jgi:hypothetical protein